MKKLQLFLTALAVALSIGGAYATSQSQSTEEVCYSDGPGQGDPMDTNQCLGEPEVTCCFLASGAEIKRPEQP